MSSCQSFVYMYLYTVYVFVCGLMKLHKKSAWLEAEVMSLTVSITAPARPALTVSLFVFHIEVTFS